MARLLEPALCLWYYRPVELLTFKLIAAAAIFAVAIIGGVIPLFAARYMGSQRFFSLGNAFAGGLFLGIGFIHLLPDRDRRA